MIRGDDPESIREALLLSKEGGDSLEVSGAHMYKRQHGRPCDYAGANEGQTHVTPM